MRIVGPGRNSLLPSIAASILSLAGAPLAAVAEGSPLWRQAAHEHFVDEGQQLLEELLGKSPVDSRRDAESILRSLIAAHRSVTADDQRLIYPLTLDRSRAEVRGNEAWLRLARRLVRERRFLPALEALERLQQPVSEDQARIGMQLELQAHLHSGRSLDAERLETAAAMAEQDPVLAFNLALLRLRRGESETAQAALQRLADATSASRWQREVGAESRIALARLQRRQGHIDAARELAGAVDPDSMLFIDALALQAELAASAGDLTALGAALHALRERAPSHPTVTLAQVHWVRTLEEQGARAQAGQAASEASNDLLRRLRGADGLAQATRNNTGAGGIRPDARAAYLRYMLKADPITAVLSERQDRLRRLQDLLARWRPRLAAYGRLLRAGPERLRARVGALRSDMRTAPPGDREPGGRQLAQRLERLLDRVVGRPARWEERYKLFSGVAYWEFDKEQYRYRNWKPDPSNPDAMREAYGDAMEIDRRIESELEDHSLEPYAGLGPWIKDLEHRSAAAVSRLRDMQKRIERARRNRVLGLIAERRGELQRQLLFTATTALRLRDAHRDEGEQPWYARGRAGPGQRPSIERRLRRGPFPAPTVAGAEQGLRHLAGSAIVPQVRAAAMQGLAQLVIQQYEGQERDDVDEAVALYRRVLRDHREHVDAAEVTYQLARAHDLAGALGESLRALDTLAAEHPDWRLIEEVLFRRGELRSSLKQFGGARDAYSALLRRFPDTAFAVQGRFKLGWTLFKLGEYRRALPHFFFVLDTTLGGPEAARAAALKEKQLLDDTFRAVSLTFSHLGGAESIAAYFERHGRRAYEPEVYRNLARHYLDQERFLDAANTYRAALRRFPDRPEAPLLLASAVDVYKRGDFPSLAYPAQKEFVRRFGPGSAYWLNRRAAGRARVADRLRGYLAELASRQHARAQASGEPEDYRAAADWYERFLEAFPDSAEAARQRRLMAEALFDAGDLERSAGEFERVAYGGRPATDEAAKAGYMALLAYQKLQEAAGPSAKRGWAERLLDSGGRFVAAFPRAPETHKVLARVAEDQLWLARYSAVEVTTARLLERDPPPDLQRRAWIARAHALFALERYAEAEPAYGEALSRVPAGEEARAKLYRRRAVAVYRQAEAHQAQGETAAAVEDFLRVRAAAPDLLMAANAEFDAATLLLRMEQWERAIPVLERFRRTFAGHRLQREIPPKLAVAYEHAGRPLDAARILEQIASRDAKREVARQALWRAAELRERAGDLRAATDTLTRYIERFAEPLGAAVEARRILADWAGRAGKPARRAHWLRAIVRAHDEAGDAHTARTRYLAAQAALELADEQAQRFDSIGLRLPLDKSLERKTRAMERASRAYEKVAGYEVAEFLTAATFQIAELYRKMASAIMDSERPGGLKQLEREQYDILLEEEALPFEDKAIELHHLNVGRIGDGQFNTWVERSLSALKRLAPARYDRSERMEPYVQAIH
ncbi:MAG: tetratricopeptide repeat protein [Gammaproteobacteria bacterium]|nr:tetratricopeptide repeat protein [Gammaproteobacteria bacterium]NIR31084.1 tetratricopeptide repeat protein [Gammaproteobacteria bacterium]NIR98539.1 tetratricopeptide repeat protein [Gammaproteobacteria bacterium]NIV21866.1 tetratricopeptide repeat protein [Gammaproteobacteria bacterium]